AASGVLLCIFIDCFRTTAARLGLYKVGLDVTSLEIGTALLLIALQLRLESLPATTMAPRASGISALRRALWQSTAFVRWFGRNSYEVYLTHMLVVWPMVVVFQHYRWTINVAPLWFLLTTALAGVAGYLVARFYSEPLNRKIRVESVP